MPFITLSICILYIGKFMTELFFCAMSELESIKMRKLRCSVGGFFTKKKKVYENNTECHFIKISRRVQKTMESAFRCLMMPYQTYEGYINNQIDKSPKLQIKRKVTNWWLCITVLESFHSGIQRHSSFGGQLMLLALYLNNPMHHHHTLFISICQKAIQSYFQQTVR